MQINNLLLLTLSQLVDILTMGFENKFYNASKKDQKQSSTPGSNEYRINMSSDTPHWYIRDYLARASSQYDINGIEVDGKILCVLLFLFFTFFLSFIYFWKD